MISRPRTCSKACLLGQRVSPHVPRGTPTWAERTGPSGGLWSRHGRRAVPGPARTPLPRSLEGPALLWSWGGPAAGRAPRLPALCPGSVLCWENRRQLGHVCAMRPCPVVSRWARHPWVAFRLCPPLRQVPAASSRRPAPHRGGSGWGNGFFVNSGSRDDELYLQEVMGPTQSENAGPFVEASGFQDGKAEPSPRLGPFRAGPVGPERVSAVPSRWCLAGGRRAGG